MVATWSQELGGRHGLQDAPRPPRPPPGSAPPDPREPARAPCCGPIRRPPPAPARAGSSTRRESSSIGATDSFPPREVHRAGPARPSLMRASCMRIRASSGGGTGPKRSSSSSRSRIRSAISFAPGHAPVDLDLRRLVGHVVAGHVGVHGQVHPHRLGRLVGGVARQRAHRLVEHRHVQLEAHRRHVAGLLVAEQVARAADLEVAHGDLEARAQLGVVGERRQARPRRRSVSAAALGYRR